jgi:hypothetical protein
MPTSLKYTLNVAKNVPMPKVNKLNTIMAGKISSVIHPICKPKNNIKPKKGTNDKSVVTTSPKAALNGNKILGSAMVLIILALLIIELIIWFIELLK